eukprot:242415-Chlamydomonas_euryale.AAC.1
MHICLLTANDACLFAHPERALAVAAAVHGAVGCAAHDCAGAAAAPTHAAAAAAIVAMAGRTGDGAGL